MLSRRFGCDNTYFGKTRSTEIDLGVARVATEPLLKPIVPARSEGIIDAAGQSERLLLIFGALDQGWDTGWRC